MSNIDRKSMAAAAILEEIGYRWEVDRWVLPHTDDLDPTRRPTLIDLGDMMYGELGDNAWLAAAWEQTTEYASRHGAKPTGRVAADAQPKLVVVSRRDK